MAKVRSVPESQAKPTGTVTLRPQLSLLPTKLPELSPPPPAPQPGPPLLAVEFISPLENFPEVEASEVDQQTLASQS